MLIETDFDHAGLLKNASITMEAKGESSGLCADEDDFMNVYINVVNDCIDNIKYACVCDPTANVAVEILCTLVKGRSLDEASLLAEKEFYQFLGSTDEEFQKKVKGLKERLNRGISDFRRRLGQDCSDPLSDRLGMRGCAR